MAALLALEWPRGRVKRPLEAPSARRWLPKLLDVASEELNVKKVMLPFLSDPAGRQGHKGSQPFPRPSSVLVAVGAAVRRVMAPTHTLGPCHKRDHISCERAVTRQLVEPCSDAGVRVPAGSVLSSPTPPPPTPPLVLASHGLWALGSAPCPTSLPLP